MKISEIISQDLISALQQARHVVVFTGAGVSAESGIPTFRDAMTGLWERFDAEDLATSDAFEKDKELVWGWYEWRRMKVLQAKPNAAHLAIAELERYVPRLTVVTQNVDDLHERAGSTNVLHLHGSLHAPRCFTCSHPYQFPAGIPQEPEDGRRLSPPHCVRCGGYIRPGVVWFGETMPIDALEQSFDEAKVCDVLFTIGTSGVVYPAATIPPLAKKSGAKVIKVNPTDNPLDSASTWRLNGAAGEMLPRVLQAAFATE